MSKLLICIAEDKSRQGTSNYVVKGKFRVNKASENIRQPTISVIMPVYNGAEFVAQSLPPLMAMKDRDEILEVIVVDDLSTDDTPKIAADLGARVMPMENRSGPGAARNKAAKEAHGDIIWLVDADVVVHADAAGYLQATFADEKVVAMFGSYDDAPPAPNFASQYKNLIHHFYHQRGKREASTFWAGCGAIRRVDFLDVGGFNEAAFNRPSVEDIELGYRLLATGGKIVLEPEFQSTHLKLWTFTDMIRTDVFRRAIPWARLMLARETLTDDLNVGASERARAVLAGLFLLSIPIAIAGVVPLWVPVIMLGFAIGANAHLFRYFMARKGIVFALGALVFHQLYYCYSSAAFAFCWLENKMGQGGMHPSIR